jgi:hypothetical protein
MSGWQGFVILRNLENQLVFLIVGIEDGEGIAIRNLDDLAGEGIGRGCCGEKDEEAKCDYTDCHVLIPGIVDLKA